MGADKRITFDFTYKTISKPESTMINLHAQLLLIKDAKKKLKFPETLRTKVRIQKKPFNFTEQNLS